MCTVRYPWIRNAWWTAYHRLRGPPEHPLAPRAQNALCRLACCGSKRQYIVCAAGPAWSARLARTGLGSIRDADEDQKQQCRDPRTDAGEIANAELTAARGVGCGQKREGILEIRGRDHPWRSARLCRSTQQTTEPPARAARLQRPGDLPAKGTPRRKRQRYHHRRYPSGAFHLGLRRREDRQ